MSVRRWASAGVVGLLGLGMTLQPVASHGAVRSALMEAAEWASVEGDPGCGSPRFTGARPGVVTVPADGRWRTVRLDRSGSTDASTFRATAVVTGRVSGNAWGATRVRMRATAGASATPRMQSNACSPTVQVTTRVTGTDVTAPKRSWLVVRGSARAHGTTGGAVGIVASDGSTEAVVRPGRSLTRLVGPGSYTVGGTLNAQVTVPFGSLTARASGASADVAVSILPVGTLRAQRGKALRFLRAGHRNCTDHKVRLGLSRSLPRRAKRVTLYVNGDRRTVLTGRELRRSAVVLRRIAPRSDGVIRAVVVRKSGVRESMRAASWPCR